MTNLILDSKNSGIISVIQFATVPNNTFDYITSSKAISRNFIEVTEINEGGSVNNLLIINHSNEYVFFSDGDFLIGAKQNRVLNTSVLLKPNFRQVVPVSCVESGRWGYTTRKFDKTDYSAPAKMRKDKSKEIKCNLDQKKSHYADQGKVWDNVNLYSEEININSPTSDFHFLYCSVPDYYEDKIKDFELCPESNGLAVFVKNKILTIDIFNRCDVYEEYFPKILKSSILDVHGYKDSEFAFDGKEIMNELLKFLDNKDKMEFQEYPGVSAGIEKRYETNEISGFELVHENHLIHFTAFG